MGNNSQWIETELERGEEIYLVPLRSRLETRKNRLRTVIQRPAAFFALGVSLGGRQIRLESRPGASAMLSADRENSLVGASIPCAQFGGGA